MATIGNEQRVFEWRRLGHWRTSAEKARLSAFLLWRMRDSRRFAEAVTECANSHGDAELAALVDLPRFRGEMRAWDQALWLYVMLSSGSWHSLVRPPGGAILPSRPVH